MRRRAEGELTESMVEPVKPVCETWPCSAWKVESGMELTWVIASFPPRTYVRLFSDVSRELMYTGESEIS